MVLDECLVSLDGAPETWDTQDVNIKGEYQQTTCVLVTSDGEIECNDQTVFAALLKYAQRSYDDSKWDRPVSAAAADFIRVLVAHNAVYMERDTKRRLGPSYPWQDEVPKWQQERSIRCRCRCRWMQVDANGCRQMQMDQIRVVEH